MAENYILYLSKFLFLSKINALGQLHTDGGVVFAFDSAGNLQRVCSSACPMDSFDILQMTVLQLRKRKHSQGLRSSEKGSWSTTGEHSLILHHAFDVFVVFWEVKGLVERSSSSRCSLSTHNLYQPKTWGRECSP